MSFPPLGLLQSAVTRGTTAAVKAMPAELRAAVADDVLRYAVEMALRAGVDAALAWLADQQGIRVGVRVGVNRVDVVDDRLRR